MKIARISEPALRPMAAPLRSRSSGPISTSNKRPKQIYICPLAGGIAGADHQRRHEQSAAALDAGFEAHRVRLGSRRVIADLDHERRRLRPEAVTNLATGASGVIVSPDGKNIVFTSDVYPGCADDACNKSKLEAEKEQGQGTHLHIVALSALE